MNLTLSVDDNLVEKARQVASRQGTSLQALVRQYIETLAGSREGAALVQRLEEQWREADKHLRDGQFPAGSMGPKIEAAAQFVRATGGEVLITDVEHLRDALAGKDGTRVVA